MKIINIFRLVIALPILGLLLSCSKSADITPGSYLSTTPTSRNEVDIWIEENFTKPYNIEVVYRWSEPLGDAHGYLYPPTLDSVKPVLKVIKKLWIEPYSSVADPWLVSKIAPRQLVLVGGIKAFEGGAVLGRAELGRRITIYQIDLINKRSRNDLTQILHVMQHEYVHILNQTKSFDQRAFGKITPNYTATNEIDGKTLQAMGFITAYSRTNAWEDFAEMVSVMLVHNRSEWDELVNYIPDPGKSKIREKEQMVAGYYKTAYGIDLYQLQEKVQGALMKISSK